MSAAETQRRLTTIVAADVAGYSRLIAEDEEATIAAIRDLRAGLIDGKIAAYRGRIANTAGDSLLIEFPSIVDALRCAIDLQRGLAERNSGLPADRRIEFRMGINLGDVVEQDGDLLGDGVNVAARLEGIAEPGGICLSAAAYEQVRDRVDIGFADIGSQALKNIPTPVRVYRVLLDGRGTTPARRTVAGRRGVAAAAALLLAAFGAGLWWWGPWRGETDTARSEKPSIAVLPFTNMSNDAQQEYFSDGVTEDLITDLSRMSGLFVIARNTVFTYKGRAVNVKQVSEDLGVRYVLEGSVRRSGDRVRITAQLIDARTGGHVWADRFDRKLGDIFALQDDVTRHIVSALAPELAGAAPALSRRSDKETTPEVYDLYLRGVEALRQYTRESIAEARTYFLKALARDPDYARAYAAVAFTYTAGSIFFQTERTEEAANQAVRYALRALELDDTLPQGHFSLAIAYLRQRRHDDALAAARKAVRYDPNYSDGYAALANILTYTGEGEEAARLMRHAMKLNPRYSAAYIDILGRAYFSMGQYDKAIAELGECISRDPAAFLCHTFLAAAYGLTGRLEEARWQAQEVLSLDPGFSLRTDIIAPQYRNAEHGRPYQSGLRMAGIPEG